jgi:uncharacterized protein YbjT (DUF2867 family)
MLGFRSAHSQSYTQFLQRSCKKLATLSNVSVVQADFSDRKTLVKAFAGAGAVYAVTNYSDAKVQEDILEEARQGSTIADIAKEASVKLVIWSAVPTLADRGRRV